MGVTLKNDENTCDFDDARSTRARKVLKPPFRTAGPMFWTVRTVLSLLLPVTTKNITY